MQRSISSLLITSFVLTLPAAAQHVLRTIDGFNAGDHFASCVIDAGDLDHDGYHDLLAGAPGFNAARGVIYAVSGHFLATGSGASTLWSQSPPSLQPGDQFGASLAAVGDLTGDGVADFAVGAPSADVFGTDNGRVYFVNGATHATSSSYTAFMGTGQRFGYAMDVYGDWNGDGKLDLVVGAPGASRVLVVSGTDLVAGGQLPSYLGSFNGASGALFGWSVASGFDFEGDGDNDLFVGAPLFGSAQGSVSLLLRSGSALVLSGTYTSPNAGDHLGLSVDAAHDYDGDGYVDVIVGIPYADTSGSGDNGRAIVLSGAHINASLPILFDWTPASSGVYFGSAVRASGDLNGDGVGDILVGGPSYGPNNGGRAWIYSGATGEFVGSIVGSAEDRLGDSLLGAFDDLDGDGYPEFAVAGPFSDDAGNDAGILKCVQLFPVHASSYCTGKPNSLGCTPGMSAQTGYASVSSSAPFAITGFDFLNQKNGLLFYGYDANAAPFQGGTLCVKQPIHRTAMQNSGGDTSGNTCTGVYAFDFNAYLDSGVDPQLVIGRQVFCQYWSRDPASPSTTSLSDALRVFVNP